MARNLILLLQLQRKNTVKPVLVFPLLKLSFKNKWDTENQEKKNAQQQGTQLQ